MTFMKRSYHPVAVAELKHVCCITVRQMAALNVEFIC